MHCAYMNKVLKRRFQNASLKNPPSLASNVPQSKLFEPSYVITLCTHALIDNPTFQVNPTTQLFSLWWGGFQIHSQPNH